MRFATRTTPSLYHMVHSQQRYISSDSSSSPDDLKRKQTVSEKLSASSSTATSSSTTTKTASTSASATTTSTSTANTQALEEKKKERIGLKEFATRYGAVGIATYLTVYVGTLSSLFLLLKTSIISPDDTIAFVKNSKIISSVIDPDLIHPEAGTFAVAWILTKFTEPLRLAFTLAITPSVSKFIRKA